MKRQIQARAHAHSNSTQVLEHTPERGKAKCHFARAQDESYALVREHTPIYDLPAYLQRQKKQKIVKLRNNVFQTCTFLFGVIFTFSIFLGK